MKRIDVCVAERHGTATAYKNHGCKCPEARTLGLRQDKQGRYRRAKGFRGRPDLVPVLGTQRRIRALMALGWTCRAQTEHAGVSVAQLLHQRGERNHTTRLTAQKVAAMYRELNMTLGPSAESRRRAFRNGYPPPLAWDDIDDPREQPKHRLEWNRGRIPRERMDEDVVEAAFAWRRPRMSFMEQRRVVDTAIDDRGMFMAEVADMLGVTVSAVKQTRTRSNQARTAAARKARDGLAVAS